MVSVEDFEAQMLFLFENEYTTISLNELHAFLYKKKPLPEKSVMITFDDGYYSNIEYAYPILKEYGFKAVIFLITRNADDILPRWLVKPPPDSLITKSVMEGTEDVFEYATHTHDLHSTPDGKSALVQATHEEIIHDIQVSLEWVTNPFALAYPHGGYNETVLDAIKEAGIEMAFTIAKGYIRMDSNPFTLKRMVIYKETTITQLSTYINGRK